MMAVVVEGGVGLVVVSSFQRSIGGQAGWLAERGRLVVVPCAMHRGDVGSTVLFDVAPCSLWFELMTKERELC